MFFSGDDEDQDFLSPGGTSKLGSLFGQDQSMSQGGNESLTYTAPKEPKKQKPGSQADNASAPAVLNAAAVHAYKYADGNYASQGKLGCAVLGNHLNKDYKLLLYKTKQQQITNAKITSTFLFSVQQNNYASFYDDGRHNWSLNFDSEQQLSNFAKQICLCKFSSSESSDTVAVQDLTPGEGGTLENGDSAEVKYTGWLLSENTFGEVFDNNEKAEKLFRFKFGKGKVIKGWEEGMLGMKKGGKRLIVVPPKLGYGDKGASPKVPPGATLIFHVEVIRVKLAKDKDSPASGRASPTTVHVSTGQEEEGVKARSKSISDQLQQTSTNPKSDKAKLISRMAKMGQPMLPMTGAVPAQTDADEEDETQSTSSAQETPTTPTDVKPPKPAKPVHHTATHTTQPAATPPAAGYPPQAGYPYPQEFQQPMMAQPGIQPMMAQPGMAQPMMAGAPHPSVFQGVPAAAQVALYQSPQQFQQQFQPPGYQQTTAVSSANDSSLPVLLTESRSHNTEVRLAITKVQEKIDTMSQKFDQTFGGGLGLSPTMETSVLMHNIQRIVQENERMKKELFEKSAKLEAQNEKIAELLQRNQQYVEQSHVLLEQRNDAFKTTAASSQAKVLTLEQEKVQLATELSAATAQLTTLQLEVSNLHKREAELQKQIELSTNTGNQNKHEINELKSQNTDFENQIAELTSSLKVERQGRKTAESKITALEDEITEVKSTNKNLEKTLADRKKRAAHEKEQLEQELEEIKSQNEKEVTDLKDRIRKVKTSSDTATAEQVSHIEQELENTWQEKLDRMLASANDRHQRALGDLQEEKATLEAKVKDMQEKFQEFRASRGDADRQTMELQEELEEMKIWKTKYENLRAQATTMKERYEDRIQEVEGEKETLEETREKLKEQMRQLQTALQKAQVQAEAATAAAAVAGAQSGDDSKMDKTVVTAEVKKIMNSVYQQMRGEFERDESYQGSDIHGVILNTIKEVTLKMLNPQAEVDEEEEETEEGAAVEEQIEATSATMSQAKVPLTDTSKQSDKSDEDSDLFEDAEDRKTATEESIASKSSQPLGDKGNPEVTKQLDQLEKADTVSKAEKAVEPSQSTPLGDKGNPEVTKQLDKLDNASNRDSSNENIEESDDEDVKEDNEEDVKEDNEEDDQEEQWEEAEETREKDIEEGEGMEGVAIEETKTTVDESEKAPEKEDDDPFGVPDDDDDEFFKPEEPVALEESPESSESSEENETETSAQLEKAEDVAESVIKSITKTDEETTVKPLFSSQLSESTDKKQSPEINDPLFAGELNGSTTTTKSTDKNLKKSDAKKSSTSVPIQDGDDPLFSAATSKPASKTETKKKATTASSKPLFDDEKPLFGEDDNVADTLGLNFKADKKETAKKGETKKTASDSDDDYKGKAPPPPLFGDDDDDDDLDWLS